MPSLCFAIYIGFGNTIDLATAVVAMIYFGRLYWCMSWLPICIIGTGKFLMGLRTNKFTWNRHQNKERRFCLYNRWCSFRKNFLDSHNRWWHNIHPRSGWLSKTWKISIRPLRITSVVVRQIKLCGVVGLDSKYDR